MCVISVSDDASWFVLFCYGYDFVVIFKGMFFNLDWKDLNLRLDEISV